MEGARGDVAGGFRSVLDILAVVAARSERHKGGVAAPPGSPLLLKRPGEDDWRPLVAGVPEPV